MSFLLLHMHFLMSHITHDMYPSTHILLYNLCHLMPVSMCLQGRSPLHMITIYPINLFLKLHFLLLFHHLTCLLLTVISTMMVTTDTFVPTYPWGFFLSGTETQHIWMTCRNLVA